jgi:hypothetical protein
MEENIKMYLREIGCQDVGWIHLAQAGSYVHGNEPSGSIKGGEVSD